LIYYSLDVEDNPTRSYKLVPANKMPTNERYKKDERLYIPLAIPGESAPPPGMTFQDKFVLGYALGMSAAYLAGGLYLYLVARSSTAHVPV
jgi:hypothetical protein